MIKKRRYWQTIGKILLSLTLAGLLHSCTARHQIPVKQYEDYSRQSGIYSIPLNDTTLENLAVLAKVWGFVKYYHPVFQDSVFSIDYELFELMPKVLSADYTMRNRILCDWIDSLGPFSTDEQQYRHLFSDTAVQRMVSYDWMNDSGKISNELSGKLKALIYAERDGNNIYAFVSVPHNSNFLPVFKNERTYSQITVPDCGYRLLALFRYWNMIEYYFPARHLIQKDWDGVLRKYIPLFAKCNFMNEYPLVCYRLFAEIEDTHATPYSLGSVFGNKVLPARFQYAEGKWVISHLYLRDSTVLKKGDILLSINGIPVDSLEKAARIYVSASNESAFYRETAKHLQMTPKETVLLQCKRGDTIVSSNIHSLTPDNPEQQKMQYSYSYDHPAYCFINDTTGYICIDKYNQEQMKKTIVKMLGQVKNLILDNRSNSNRYFWELASEYLVRDHFNFIKWYVPVGVLPGMFRVCKNTNRYGKSKTGRAYEGKIILLVNERTQSSYEFLSLFLQSRPDITTIGNTTAGAGGSVVLVPLPGHVETVFTMKEFLTPSGVHVRRGGIPLDEKVPVTINGIREGRDEVYERALELLRAN